MRKKDNKKQLTDEEIEKIMEKKYSNKLPHTKDYIREQLKKDSNYICKFNMVREDFIEEADKTHKYKYNYEFVPDIIKNTNTKLTIICLEIDKSTGKIYGEFKVDLDHFIKRKQNHPKLAKDIEQERREIENRKKFFEEVSNKFPWISLEKSEYKGMKESIICTCKKHGEFSVVPINLLHSDYGGCPECYKENSYTLDSVIERTNKKFNELYGHDCNYDFSLAKLHGLDSNIDLICPIHGVFQTKPNYLIYRGAICPKCREEQDRLKREKEFIERSINLFGNKYEYSKVHFTRGIDKVTLICPEHGEFNIIARSHLLGAGCPKCSASAGEILLMNILNELGIKYTYLYEISNNYIINNGFSKLVIDFCVYLEKGIYCFVEINGEQHYNPVNIFGGVERFNRQFERDNLLKKYCNLNKIPLIEIPFLYKDERKTYNKIVEIKNIIKDLFVGNKISNIEYLKLFPTDIDKKGGSDGQK